MAEVFDWLENMPKFTKRKTELKRFNKKTVTFKKKTVRLKDKNNLPSDNGEKYTEVPASPPPLSSESQRINQMIDEATERLNRISLDNGSDIPSFTPHPTQFDGISNSGEGYKLLHHEISTEQRKARELEERLKIIQMDFEQEKSQLTETINDLKRELHRTKPIHDNALFSLSRELRDTVKDMEQLMNETSLTSQANQLPQSLPATQAALTQPTGQNPPPVAASPTVQPKTVTKTTAISKNEDTTSPKTENPDTTKKKGKFLPTAIAFMLILVLLSGGTAFSIIKKPKVDQKIVEEYLQKNSGGAVAGAHDTGVPSQPQQTDSQDNTPTQPTMDTKKLEADIPFEQTIWDTIKEPNFGIKVQYPTNTSEILKTDSNITFLRKNGYIFKVQRIETALSPEEYWKQIKATSLNYRDTKQKYLNREALFLEIDDVTDYPGNRYLVKEGNFLFDIWYAIEGSVFAADDVRRAKYMLDTLSFDAS